MITLGNANIQKIEIDYDKFCGQFGCSTGDGATTGELAKHYPGLFREEIALSFYPKTLPELARFKLALNMMSDHIHYYAEPRYDNEGFMLFHESTGFEEAERMHKSYVIMEDLS